jgi:hypothetical protein
VYKFVYDERKNEWVEDKRNNTYEQIELCSEAQELNNTLIRTNNVIFNTLLRMFK